MLSEKEIEKKLFSKFNHDLRGSFVSILGYTDILTDPKEEVTQQELNEFVKRIDFRTKEAYNLLEDFINWLKVKYYNDSLTYETISLNDIITETLFAFQKRFDEKSVTIKKDLTANLTVQNDIQILQSIFKNTFKFIEKYISENATLSIGSNLNDINAIITFDFDSAIKDYETEALLSLSNKKPDVQNIPNEILFTKYFTESCNGKFDLTVEDNSKIKASVSLRRKN